MQLNQKRPKIFYGWWIVAASLLITLFIGGIVFFGFTSIVEPIAKEFGWSYAQISFASSLRGLEMGLLAPLVGFLADRWGPRRLTFSGSIIVGLGLIALSQVSSLGTFYLAFTIIAIGMTTCIDTMLITVVGKWFRKKIGIATGIVVSGFGLGGLLVPLVTVLVDTLRWRMAMLSLSLGMIAIVMPLSLVLRHKPEQYGYLPDGELSTSSASGKIPVLAESAEINVPAKQVLKSSVFWHVALAAMCHSFVIGAIITHIMPFLSSVGITRTTASLVALLLPVISVGGRLGVGLIKNRSDEKRIFAVAYALMTIGTLSLGYVAGGTTWLLVFFAIVFGFGWGTSVTTRMVLLRKHFGRSSFGTILGFTSGVMMIGGIAGAPLTGWVFDTWGSYQGMWFGLVSLTFIGFILALTTPAIGNTVKTGDNPGMKPNME